MRNLAAAALISMFLCAPAHAAPPDDPLAAAAESFIHGLVHERDVDLVFGYLREALDAAVEGRELPPPEALTQRVEAIGEEAKQRGAIAGRAVLDAIERSIRDAMKTPGVLPSSRPLQRL
ncbi:MAG: hypothetical protein JWO70_3510 [Betaproteobacteria bacterium]|jgi:hypothetical protein|nr:hypothetical protein [Betaproteobacteria bacterium]